MGDEDSIMQCIEEHVEQGGISTFAITTELKLPASTISPIVDRLEREERIHGEKRKFIFYWKPGPPPKKSEEDAAWAKLAEAPVPKDPAPAQEAAVVPTKEVVYSPGNKCPWCGCNNSSAEVLEKHKKKCAHNPDRKRKKAAPKHKSPPEERTCPDCGTEFPTLLGKKRHKCMGKAEGPDLEDLKAEMAKEDKDLPAPQAVQEPGPAPGPKRTGGRPPKDPMTERMLCPIEGCGKLLTANRDNVKHHLARHKLPGVEALAYLDKMFPKPAGKSTEIPIDDQPAASPADPEQPAGAPLEEVLTKTRKDDPLADFAQRHRHRLHQEITRLGTIERSMRKKARKLRRNADAAEAMASRVKAAKRTKERELRRFEKELTEVQAVSR